MLVGVGSMVGLSVTDAGGALADDFTDCEMCGCAEADVGLGFEKGTGVFLVADSFGGSLLSIFFPFLPLVGFSFPVFRSVISLSSPFPLCLLSLLPSWASSPLSLLLRLLLL